MQAASLRFCLYAPILVLSRCGSGPINSMPLSHISYIRKLLVFSAKETVTQVNYIYHPLRCNSNGTAITRICINRVYLLLPDETRIRHTVRKSATLSSAEWCGFSSTMPEFFACTERTNFATVCRKLFLNFFSQNVLLLIPICAFYLAFSGFIAANDIFIG